jgi:hypothetical protein
MYQPVVAQQPVVVLCLWVLDLVAGPVELHLLELPQAVVVVPEDIQQPAAQVARQ